MIYFAQDENGSIKIGKTKCIATLRTGSPSKLIVLKTIDGYTSEEKEIHNKFRHLKLNGEWFKPSEELLNYIDSLKQTNTVIESGNTRINSPKLYKILALLGRNIKLARLRRKLTATLLSERVGISRTLLRAIENGDPGVSIGNYANVLLSLNLENDLEMVAKDDAFGRKLQDAELLQEDREE